MESRRFRYNNYLSIDRFNESDISFKWLETFTYGFLTLKSKKWGKCRYIYSYHNYYIEVIFCNNSEEIESIIGISIEDALKDYTHTANASKAIIDLMS